MNIYLLIEVKVRELEGKLLLALTAAERGHTVIIGEKKDTLNFAKTTYLPPGVVHDKSLTPGGYKIENFTKLKENGHVITAQDEESGLLDESFDHFAKRRFSEETVSLADKIFTWGQHDTKSLQKIYPKYADKIIPTGSPRVDFWRREFDPYYKKNGINQKPFIFIASNFGYPIDENPIWNRVARLRKAGYFERDPDMEQYMYENTAYQFRLMYHFIEMIRELSQQFSERKILVRPHPVESIEAWEKLLGELPNVIVERKDTISRWIRNASVLVHNGCTSALEASVSGLPRVAYRPIPHELEREIPNGTSLHAFSLDELKKMVSDILETGSTEGLAEAESSAKKILDSRFSSLEGTYAAEKIVDEWEKSGGAAHLGHSTPEELLRIKKQYSKEQKRKNFKQKLKVKAVDIRNMLLNRSRGKSSGNLLKSGHKFPYLDLEEVNEIIANVQSSLDRFHSISIKQFGENSYIIFDKSASHESS